MEQRNEYLVSYRDAVKFLNNSLILCNEIPNIDTGIWDYLELPEDMEMENFEVFQYYLMDINEEEKNYLTTHFPDLVFSYSQMLDLYVLLVTHIGTSWDYIGTTAMLTDDEAQRGKFAQMVKEYSERR